MQPGELHTGVLHQRDDLRAGRHEFDEPLPELPACDEHSGLDRSFKRNELRRRRGMQPGELHVGVFHRRDDLRVGRHELHEPLPELPAWYEHKGLDCRGERNELRHGHLLLLGVRR